jgi:rhodanese-related sulfurtransferase
MEQYIEFASNHWMLATAFLAVTYFLIQDIIETSLRKYKPISPMLTVAKLNSGNPIILDVRDASEFKKGHISEAIHIPLTSLDSSMKKIELYKSDEVIVVCQTGMRSTSACDKLTKAGFENLYSMTGGIQSWEENKLPVTTDKK